MAITQPPPGFTVIIQEHCQDTGDKFAHRPFRLNIQMISQVHPFLQPSHILERNGTYSYHTSWVTSQDGGKGIDYGVASPV